MKYGKDISQYDLVEIISDIPEIELPKFFAVAINNSCTTYENMTKCICNVLNKIPVDEFTTIIDRMEEIKKEIETSKKINRKVLK